VAQASVNVSVLVDTPEIQALEQDLERIIELLEESQVSLSFAEEFYFFALGEPSCTSCEDQ